MHIIESIERFPETDKAVILTMGNFDGVHIGHRTLIRQVVDRAVEKSGISVLMTFVPHPVTVLNPGMHLNLINDFTETAALIKELGIDILLKIHFTKEFARIPAATFVKDHLIRFIRPQEIFVGENHRFGHDRAGGLEVLAGLCRESGIEFHTVASVRLKGEVVSSTRVREKIHSGELAIVREMLGRHFHLRGLIRRGAGRGAGLGFPTANIRVRNRVLPPPGVYATVSCFHEIEHPSMSYIGSAPTFGGEIPQIETHIFYVQEELYGKTLRIKFLDRIRPEICFNNQFDLVRRMKQDAREAMAIYHEFKSKEDMNDDLCKSVSGLGEFRNTAEEGE